MGSIATTETWLKNAGGAYRLCGGNQEAALIALRDVFRAKVAAGSRNNCVYVGGGVMASKKSENVGGRHVAK